jgi:hypothetical protein
MFLFSLINLSLFRYTYAALAAFAQTIHDGFIAEVADYATPNPLMAAFQADIDALNIAVANWGIQGNRGSHAAHLALVAAAIVVKNDLRMLAEYAQNTQPNNPDSWERVGFKAKRPKSAVRPLEMVQNFRHFISRNVPPPFIKLRWKRPLNTAKGDVKGYLVQRNNVGVYPVDPDGGRGIVNVIGLMPNTSFIDEDPFVGANYYWVTPFNSLGLGVTSSEVMVVSAKAKIS